MSFHSVVFRGHLPPSPKETRRNADQNALHNFMLNSLQPSASSSYSNNASELELMMQMHRSMSGNAAAPPPWPQTPHSESVPSLFEMYPQFSMQPDIGSLSCDGYSDFGGPSFGSDQMSSVSGGALSQLDSSLFPGISFPHRNPMAPGSSSMGTPPLSHSPPTSESSSGVTSYVSSPLFRNDSSLPIDPNATSAEGRTCAHCGTGSTSAWRRVPGYSDPMCNACGLYLQQRNMLRPQNLIDADAQNAITDTTDDPSYIGPECSHCHTRKTSVWRRSKDGLHLCNACGVYSHLRGKERPLSLKKNTVKPRAKRDTSTASSPTS